jgi:hypothetical protein
MSRRSGWDRAELIAKLAAKFARAPSLIAKAIEELSRIH